MAARGRASTATPVRRAGRATRQGVPLRGLGCRGREELLRWVAAPGADSCPSIRKLASERRDCSPRVGLISPPMGPMAHWALDSRPDRGPPAR
jgi:hypothetical protein